MELEIRENIGDCKNIKCGCDAKNNPFVRVFDKEAFIYDDDFEEKGHPCKLVSKENNHHLIIVNKTRKPFTFVKFDACLVNDDEKKCDALVYSDNEFYFVEIKDTTVKGRRNARNEALSQLEKSVLRLEKVDFNDRVKYAIVGFAKPSVRIKSTGNDAKKVYFMEQYGIKLMEGQTIPLY